VERALTRTPALTAALDIAWTVLKPAMQQPRTVTNAHLQLMQMATL